MTQVLLVAHGELALAMKNSVEMIFGEVPFFTAIPFYKEEGLDAVSNRIEQAVKGTDESVFIFADLFCGTPYNAACAVAMKYRDREIEVVSGMSLPLLLEIVTTIQTVNIDEMANLVMVFASETTKRFVIDDIAEDDEL